MRHTSKTTGLTRGRRRNNPPKVVYEQAIAGADDVPLRLGRAYKIVFDLALEIYQNEMAEI